MKRKHADPISRMYAHHGSYVDSPVFREGYPVEEEEKIYEKSVYATNVCGYGEIAAHNADAEEATYTVTVNGVSYPTYSEALLAAVVDEMTTGTGTQEDPCHTYSIIDELVITGECLEGFKLSDAFRVYYNPTTYVVPHYEIGKLIFKNATFNEVVYFTDVNEGSIKIDELIVENCVFDLPKTTEVNSSLHIICEAGDYKNIIVKNCHFMNCERFMKEIGIDYRCENHANITIEGCKFEGCMHNAIQLAGSNSIFGGEINIVGNIIKNTSDRAIRLSDVSGSVCIEANTIHNAHDTDNEVFKCSSVKEGGVVTFANNMYDSMAWEPVAITGPTDGAVAYAIEL